MDALFFELRSSSLDLVLLMIAITIHLLLAIAVYRTDRESSTNRIFALLTLSTIAWLAVIYIVRIPSLVKDPIYLHRLAIFFAAPMSFLFFLLSHTFPSRGVLLSRRIFIAGIGGTLLMMALNISPLAFVSSGPTGKELIPGPGLVPFSILSSIFSILAIYYLIKKYVRAEGDAKHQLRLVLGGMLTMLALVIGTILVPILVFNSLMFLPFASLYTLAFLGATGYAITKYRLFNVKVLLAEVLTLTICVVLFARMFAEETTGAVLIDILILAFTALFGYFLVRSVEREVVQRETIEAQARELSLANEQQESLLHFISHEIKGYLTKNEAAFAGIVEGDFGAAPPMLASMAESALVDTRRGVGTVKDILDAANLKKGTVAFDNKDFDIARTTEEAVRSLTPSARERGLDLTLNIERARTFLVRGDEGKIRNHVIRNIIDNSIRYTQHGSVSVHLTRSEKWVRIAVVDTGIGISREDQERLFQAGGHGKDSIKINVHSTGYGLFIAKSIVDAHGGKIWAESAGEGKGSRFVIELPSV